MLVGIHPCISPELLYALARMGHGDEIAVVDAYYPGHGNNDLVIRCDGSTAVEMLAGVLQLLCLDDYVAAPVAMMQPEAHDRCDPELERDFRAAFAIVVTGERRKYGNILLRKGVPGPQ
jgi:L-fucose mutarotase